MIRFPRRCWTNAVLLRLLMCLSGWQGFAAAIAAEPAPHDVAYDNFAALTRRLQTLAEADEVELSSLGKTLRERDIWLLKIQGQGAGPRPALLLLGSVDAAQLAGGELAMQMAEQLVADLRGDDPERRKQARDLLDRVTLYVIPRPSPDGSERYFARLRHESAINERATDDDRDGDIDEDDADDLNGDGLITQMRVEDPRGEYVTHPNDERVLVPADPQRSERGRFRLFTEGRDDDGDGKWNEDGPGGVDFNRNFTFEYPYFSNGAGPHQVSERESRAVADFMFAHPELAAVYCFAAQDNIHHPWKPNSGSENSRYKTAILSADAPYAEKLAEQFRGFLDQKNAPPAADWNGSFPAWAYFHFGRWSFAARPWWTPHVSQEERDPHERYPRLGPQPPEPEEEPNPRAERSDDSRAADQLNALRWLERERIAGFVPWKKIEHPDFPGQVVEVGGFHPYVLLNPPKQMLSGLAARHLQCLHELAGRLPQLSLPVARLETLGDNALRLTVVARNDGFLPTMSAQGAASRNFPVTQLELTLPENVRLLSGNPREKLPVLAGAGGTAERTWVLLVEKKSEKPIRVRVSNPAVGQAETSVPFSAARRAAAAP